jgi:CheY-like chemotaxis protein
VLVVDDEPSVRRVAARMLQRLGYETAEAADGREALRRVRSGPEPYDLVLLDLDMPGLDGRGCVLALRDLAPGLPVLLSTGLPTGELDAAVLAAVSGLLPKPYELSELSRAVAEALAGRR